MGNDLERFALAQVNQMHLPDTPRGESDDDPDLGTQITIPAPAAGYDIPSRVIGRAGDLSRYVLPVMRYGIQST